MYKVLSAIVGSTAYGLATPDSDKDILGVFLEPTCNIVSLNWNRHKETYTHTDPDWTYHELGKFIGLVLKGNPSLVEMLFMEEYETRSLVGNLLIENRSKLLSRKAIATSYIGYAIAQIKRYESHTGRYNNEKAARKNARHTFRLLVQACELLTTGNMQVRLSPETADLAWELADYAIQQPEVFKKQCDLWIQRTKNAAKRSPLPEEPDIEFIDNVLIQIRDDYFWKTPLIHGVS